MSSYALAETVLDEEEVLSRCVSVEELIDRIRQRRDIFFVDRENRLSFTEGICLTIAILMGIFLSTRTVIRIVDDPPMSANHGDQHMVSMKPGVIERNPGVLPPHHPAADVRTTPRPIRKAAVSTVRFERGSGIGDRRARIAKKGIFEFMAKGKISGMNVAVGDPESAGGTGSNIDAILQGSMTLKAGSAGSGRMGEAGIGFANGAGTSGFDGGSGIDDEIGALVNSSNEELTLRRPAAPSAIHEPVFTEHSGAIVGGRSREEILRILQENMPTLRYAYNRWLRTNPTMHGRITVRFAIDEFGKVVYCEVADAFTDDAAIRSQVVGIIKNLRFDKIDKIGDMTEVVYPLVFSR